MKLHEYYSPYEYKVMLHLEKNYLVHGFRKKYDESNPEFVVPIDIETILNQSYTDYQYSFFNVGSFVLSHDCFTFTFI
jgi:hypothetical protein